MRFYQFIIFLFFFIFLFCYFGNRIYSKMTVPYIVQQSIINNEDTCMNINDCQIKNDTSKIVENFDNKKEEQEQKQEQKQEQEQEQKQKQKQKTNMKLLDEALYSNTIPSLKTNDLLHLSLPLVGDNMKYDELDKIYNNPFYPDKHEHNHFKPSQNYSNPDKMVIVERNSFKFGYPNGMTMQDYVNWLYLFKDTPDLLNLEHYINYEKLLNNTIIKYEEDRTPPPAKILTPLNSENYFNSMYSKPPKMIEDNRRRIDGEVRTSSNQGSITNGILPYNYEKYGDFKQNFDVLGMNGKIYNKDLADKTDPYFLGAMIGPNWNTKNLG